jgi:hypothetical protein
MPDAPVCRSLRKEQSHTHILGAMSHDLRSKVLLHTYSKWLSVVPFLRKSVTSLSSLPAADARAAEVEHSAFMMALAAVIEIVAFAPLEAVLRPLGPCDGLYVYLSLNTHSCSVGPAICSASMVPLCTKVLDPSDNGLLFL